METGVAGDTGVKEMTIEAIKEALDALEDLLYHDEEPDQRLGRAVYVLQEAVKEAEKQEPVAWMYVNTDGECEQIEYGLCDFDDPSIQLLYTAPRQWVGLTDEEKRQIVLDDPIDWVAAIEAKLKKKNETS
jgi:hypothetical protein